MSSTVKLGGNTGPISPVLDTSNSTKTPNHGINLTSHLLTQHTTQNNSSQELVPTSPNTTTPVVTPIKVTTENSTNCSPDKLIVSPVSKVVSDALDDKILNSNITKTNNISPKLDILNVVIDNNTPEVVNSVKNSLSNSTQSVVPPSPTKSCDNDVVNSNVSSTKVTDDENVPSGVSENTKELESSKSTQANNNVSSSTNTALVSSSSSPNIVGEVQPTVQITVEHKPTVKPVSTMKLATVSSRSHIKRKRDLKTNSNSKKNLLSDDNDEEDIVDNDQKSKRTRVKTQPYQSPLPEFALITKLSANMAKTKANDDKLIIFYKNEFLAVRNSEGGFYVCQAMQNVYKSSPKIRIRWLSQASNDTTGETYSPDFYDFTDFDCILTNLNLNRVDKGLYKLPSSELERTQSILQRALNVEQGISPQLDITEEHPDGLDLSLYRDEAQLENKKSRKMNKRKKVKVGTTTDAQTSKDPLRGISSKSKHLKKSNKKRKAGKAAKSKIIKTKPSTKKSEATTPVSRTSVTIGKTRQARTITVVPSTSQLKSSASQNKRKGDPLKVTPAAIVRSKARNSARNAVTVAVATTSRNSRSTKSVKESRRGHK